MSKKVLFCATVDVHFEKFHLPYLQWFQAQGWEVHAAAAGNMELPFVDRKFDLPIERSPLRRRNVRAYRELKALIEANDYRLIHCHTPMGGVLARLAARTARKRGTQVLYTAHGFHFCKGAPLANWLLYYPVERCLARLTDCLITINEEDYALAVRHRFPAERIEHVHGVGVDMLRFYPAPPERKRELRKRMGYREDEILMFFAAEFNANKNQQMLIRALARLQETHPHVRLLLAGDGPLLTKCRQLARELQVSERVDFLGYRNDLDQLLPMCDFAVSSSHREGLPVNIMEAMASGLPIVASSNRGHRELVQDGVNGFLVEANQIEACAEKMSRLIQSEALRRRMGRRSLEQAAAFYSLEHVQREMTVIYSRYATEVGDEAEGQYYRAYI